MKKIFVILLLGMVMFSCQDRHVRHVQKVIHYYAETDLPWVIYYYDVVGKDSTWVEEKWFHENGVLQLEGQIVNNQREGEFKGYFPSGDLMSVGSFVNGKREGRGKIFYDNGQVHVENEYHEDKPVGTWRLYDEYGDLIKEGDYKDVLRLF
jgi:antitoxin component YwqK of YwqJK toxin-antitoxin module